MKKVIAIEWEASDIVDGLCVKEGYDYILIKSLGYKSDKFQLCNLNEGYSIPMFGWYSDFSSSGATAAQIAERFNRHKAKPARLVAIKFEDAESL